jgi:hypothetical protein
MTQSRFAGVISAPTTRAPRSRPHIPRESGYVKTAAVTFVNIVGTASGRTRAGRWLGQVVRGYVTYHAVPTNARNCILRLLRHLALDAGAWWQPLKGTGELEPDGVNCCVLAAAGPYPSPLPTAMLHRQISRVGAKCVGSTCSHMPGAGGVTRVSWRDVRREIGVHKRAMHGVQCLGPDPIRAATALTQKGRWTSQPAAATER